MKHRRNALFFALSLTMSLLIAACGSSSSTGSGGGRYGGSSNATPASTTSSAAMTIKTATLTVASKSLTVLTNAQGMTLYYRTSDTPSSVCSGGCANAWPPLLSTTMPGVSGTLPGTFSLLNDTNGSQVAYNGHPLYTYAGDSAAGQANGQGIGNVWFVAPTNLPASTSTPSGSTPTPGGYYSHQH